MTKKPHREQVVVVDLDEPDVTPLIDISDPQVTVTLIVKGTLDCKCGRSARTRASIMLGPAP